MVCDFCQSAIRIGEERTFTEIQILAAVGHGLPLASTFQNLLLMHQIEKDDPDRWTLCPACAKEVARRQ